MLLLQLIWLYTLLGIVLVLIFWRQFQVFSLLFSKEEKAVYLWSFDRDLRLMQTGLPLVRGSRMLDLGCGDGKALRFFHRWYGLHGVGYDINSFAIQYGKVINRLKNIRTISLHKGDLTHADLRSADYIYLYLFPQQMADLEEWIFDTICEDTIIISNTFPFKKHHPFSVVYDHKGKERIRLYRK